MITEDQKTIVIEAVMVAMYRDDYLDGNVVWTKELCETYEPFANKYVTVAINMLTALGVIK